MIWFIVGYFALAIISNVTVSYIVIHKLSNKCGNNRELFHTLIDRYFRNSDNWLERNLPLPYILDPVIKQVFFSYAYIRIRTYCLCRKAEKKHLLY